MAGYSPEDYFEMPTSDIEKLQKLKSVDWEEISKTFMSCLYDFICSKQTLASESIFRWPSTKFCLGFSVSWRKDDTTEACSDKDHCIGRNIPKGSKVYDICQKIIGSSGRKFNDGHKWKQLEYGKGQIRRRKYHFEKFLLDLCLYVAGPTIGLPDQRTLDGENYDHMEDENEKLSREVSALKSELLEKNNLRHEIEMRLIHERESFLRENKNLNEKVMKLTKELEELKVEHRETLMELGEMSVVQTAEINKTSDAKIFQRIFHTAKSPPSTMENCEYNSFLSSPMIGSSEHVNQTQASSSQMVHVLHCLPSTSQTKPARSAGGEFSFNARGMNDQTKGGESGQLQSNASHVETHSPLVPTGETAASSAENLSFPIQVNQLGEKESINLTDEPTSSITANVRNNYKLLLITVADSLLAGNSEKLREWANDHYSIEPNASATEVIFELDKKGVINAFDLSELRAFLESIVRHDLVFLIDEFCAGDYTSLRRLIHSVCTRRDRGAAYVSSRPLSSGTSNTGSTRVLERKRPNIANTSTSNVSDQRSRETLTQNHPKTTSAGFTGAVAGRNSDLVADGQEVNNTRVTPGYASPRREAISNDTPTTSGGSNGAKVSKLIRPDHSRTSNIQTSSHLARKSSSGSSQTHGNRNFNGSGRDIGKKEKLWLCTHYKRRCYVKFECCRKFWECHRCHNNQSLCGRKKLKSRDTTKIKCVKCGKEQQIGHYCVQCNIKFAEFFCGLCKHLTGMDDHPYHCDKCGICRIHGDRSFHCDVCGVCLDVQLRGNHKCRPDSAHDECCICLEDAFTGCQILPCSHKVHKVCATQMIRNGITRCPICRESFLHKIERKSEKKK